MPFVPQAVVTQNLYPGPVEVYVDNVNIGATLGGVTMELRTEYGEKTADQSPLLEGSYLRSQRGMVRFKLSDLSLTNMKNVFATVAANAGGGNLSIIDPVEIKLVGHGPNGTTRTVTIANARFTGNTSVDFNIGEQVAYDVEILMESNSGAADGNKYFTVVDA